MLPWKVTGTFRVFAIFCVALLLQIREGHCSVSSLFKTTCYMSLNWRVSYVCGKPIIEQMENIFLKKKYAKYFNKIQYLFIDIIYILILCIYKSSLSNIKKMIIYHRQIIKKMMTLAYRLFFDSTGNLRTYDRESSSKIICQFWPVGLMSLFYEYGMYFF